MEQECKKVFSEDSESEVKEAIYKKHVDQLFKMGVISFSTLTRLLRKITNKEKNP